MTPLHPESSGALVPRTTVAAIVAARDAALAKMRNAATAMHAAYLLATEALHTAHFATAGQTFYMVDRSKDEAYKRLLVEIDAERSIEAYRRKLDAEAWINLSKLAGIDDLMDRTARDEFLAGLATNVPELTIDNVYATLEGLAQNAKLIFQRSVARVFSELDRRFRSHDGFKIGSRVILTHVFSAFGNWAYHGRTEENLKDIDRVFAAFDRERGPVDLGETGRAVDADRRDGHGPRQSVTKARYYRLKAYKNGNAHLWFTDDALVAKVNKTLADFYGEVFPEAPPAANATTVNDVKSQTGALSRDLAFYPSPPDVVSELLYDVSFNDAVVLEPSAGVGDIVRGVLAWKPSKYSSEAYGALPARSVHAVEFDATRAAAIPRDPRVSVTVGNFLLLPPTPIYTHVIMNPPFEGTHWMAHVMHAFEFLAPGGVLISVLPSSAELGTSAKHEAFRDWATKHKANWQLFSDLPPESFASSGTRINTVIIRLAKKAR